MNAKIAAIVSTVLLVASVGACDKKKGKGGGSSWIVGSGGSMVRFDPAGGLITDYTLDSDADLLDIACRGELAAWVVGEQGTLLRTLDGGESWEAIDVGVTTDLLAVAAAGVDVVYAVGDGVLLASDDDGNTWRAVAGAEYAWTDVATSYDGGVALGVTADGDVLRYRSDRDGVEILFNAGAGLRGVSMTADGSRAIAVGDGGTVVDSTDGGRTWTPRDDVAGTPTLRRVQLARAGDLAVALGDAGTVARIGADIDAVQLLADDQTLRAVHLSSDGTAIAVGDDGAAFVTDDGGATWEPVELGVDATWYGVDELHGEPHL